MRLSTVALFVCIYHKFTTCEAVRYEPTWDSIDTRPLPQWYDEAKVGIFMHWGVYSVPSFGASDRLSSEWFWAYWKGGSLAHQKFMKNNYPPDFTYQEFANDFKAEFYDPEAWADLFNKSGAKYVVLTSKHHDGFTLWPSTYSFSWNAKDTGPNQDLVEKLATAIRKNTDLKFGLYYSLYEWYNPMYLSDKATKFENNTFMTNKAYPEMLEIVERYKPEVVWVDGDWDALDVYWKSLDFLTWLYNESPVKESVVVNDRWGIGIPCSHGDFYTCKDRYNPGVLQPHKWENAMTIDKYSWGYRRNANIADYFTPEELIKTMVETVSCGGNILMNVGPTSDGRIVPILQERLLQIGQWLSVNGEAIYGTKPWKYQNDSISHTWYTEKKSAVYAITLDWPQDNVLELGLTTDLFDTEDIVVTLLGNSEPLLWEIVNDTTYITFPEKSTVQSAYAWAVKIFSTKRNSK